MYFFKCNILIFYESARKELTCDLTWMWPRWLARLPRSPCALGYKCLHLLRQHRICATNEMMILEDLFKDVGILACELQKLEKLMINEPDEPKDSAQT